jgi:hypothetical protein
MKRIVEAAKARAIEVGKPDLAAAVNEIYEQSKTDNVLKTLLEAILTQNSTPKQNDEFQGYVRAAKKKLKDAKNSVRQPPAASSKTNGTQEKPQIINTSSPAKPSLPSPPLAPPESSPPIPSTELAEPAKSKVSLKLKSPAKHRRRQGKDAMSVSPRKRAGSAGSDSSLTSLTSNEGDDEDMDLDEADGLNNGPPPSAPHAARPNGLRGSKDQAAERGSLAVPSAGGAKRSSAEAELEQERDRALAAKKQKFSESIARDYDFQESSVRPSVSAPKSRASQLKRQSETNGATRPTTRGSRAVSIDGESPLSSPAPSRQSTPKFIKTAPKLGGKRAKTKQS